MAQYKVRLISEDGEVHEEDDLYKIPRKTPTNTDATSRAATSRARDPAYVQPRRQPRARLRRKIKIEVVEA